VVDLAQRATDKELLDEGVDENEAQMSLADLRFVNRWLGGRRAILRAVLPYLEGSPQPRLLDVGCGSADLPHLLWGATKGHVLVVGLDLKIAHLKQAPSEVARVVADVRSIPFAPRAFDVVTASLFLHHFDEGDIPPLLASLFDLCRRALVINDLHRAFVPYAFGRVVFPWIFRSRVSVVDGLVSIRRAFRPEELRRAFKAAGIPGPRLKASFPYRLVAVAERAR